MFYFLVLSLSFNFSTSKPSKTLAEKDIKEDCIINPDGRDLNSKNASSSLYKWRERFKKTVLLGVSIRSLLLPDSVPLRLRWSYWHLFLKKNQLLFVFQFLELKWNKSSHSVYEEIKVIAIFGLCLPENTEFIHMQATTEKALQYAQKNELTRCIGKGDSLEDS